MITENESTLLVGTSPVSLLGASGDVIVTNFGPFPVEIGVGSRKFLLTTGTSTFSGDGEEVLARTNHPGESVVLAKSIVFSPPGEPGFGISGRDACVFMAGVSRVWSQPPVEALVGEEATALQSLVPGSTISFSGRNLGDAVMGSIAAQFGAISRLELLANLSLIGSTPVSIGVGSITIIRTRTSASLSTPYGSNQLEEPLTGYQSLRLAIAEGVAELTVGQSSIALTSPEDVVTSISVSESLLKSLRIREL